MNNNAIDQLARHDIHCYGSAELLKFEKHMARYFEREYEQWQGNNKSTENYGLNSYEGEISKKRNT